MAPRWSTTDIPDQSGRVAVVTGSNSGIGLEAARELARAGAHVVLACRNAEKAQDAAADIRASSAGASVEVAALDLADLRSVRDFAHDFGGRHDGLDLLVNNAGIMAPPLRTTRDGFESQIGTNHLGHFALTGLLLERLLARPEARVTTVSSEMHKIGRLNLDDLHGRRRYRRWKAYGQSKLANLLFMFELDRRARAAGAPLRSTAAHPGYASTNLQVASPPWYEAIPLRVGNLLFAQDAAGGALPTLYAATMDVPGGSFAGPDGRGGMRGAPQLVTPAESALSADDARALWERSVQLTGVDYAALQPAAV
jgi:NAD(P)-dependent dehydrogenase (short-subunit alcohol dehydrogenase family)